MRLGKTIMLFLNFFIVQKLRILLLSFDRGQGSSFEIKVSIWNYTQEWHSNILNESNEAIIAWLWVCFLVFLLCSLFLFQNDMKLFWGLTTDLFFDLKLKFLGKFMIEIYASCVAVRHIRGVLDLLLVLDLP